MPGRAWNVLCVSPLERQEQGTDRGCMGQWMELPSSNIKGNAGLNTASQDAPMSFLVIHKKRVEILTTYKSSYFEEVMNDA